MNSNYVVEMQSTCIPNEQHIRQHILQHIAFPAVKKLTMLYRHEFGGTFLGYGVCTLSYLYRNNYVASRYPTYGS